eukprot:TRINITY_DN5532_c0_g1_i3.p1 TRINITY_DN5532_c0_g1~~TRINITY_DN5532_c0_g1_i3.p1  ORF type:complete len:231 (-),score=68.48 TRINITY_DN5532_c0_g1_i3:592-1284(-)
MQVDGLVEREEQAVVSTQSTFFFFFFFFLKMKGDDNKTDDAQSGGDSVGGGVGDEEVETTQLRSPGDDAADAWAAGGQWKYYDGGGAYYGGGGGVSPAVSTSAWVSDPGDASPVDCEPFFPIVTNRPFGFFKSITLFVLGAVLVVVRLPLVLLLLGVLAVHELVSFLIPFNRAQRIWYSIVMKIPISEQMREWGVVALVISFSRTTFHMWTSSTTLTDLHQCLHTHPSTR